MKEKVIICDLIDALSGGKKLWILPDVIHSQWAKKLDWYLNFQIARSATRQPQKIPAELNQFLANEGIEIPKVHSSSNEPMMVVSQKQLPNYYTVVLPYHGDLRDWIERLQQIWSGLQKPETRVFLPTGKGTSDFVKSWGNSEPIELVSDDII